MDHYEKETADQKLLKHVIAEDPAVRAYVYSVTRGHRETEDVIQNVWQVVCAKIGEYDDNRSFRSWVLGITRLQLLKWRQAKARSREVLAPDVIDRLADDAVTQRDELSLRVHYLRQCLSELPDRGRRLFSEP